MQFNSLVFAVFLPAVLAIYWFASSRGARIQNVVLIITSYLFYAYWDWRFLSLIVISSAVDYFVGKQLCWEGATRRRQVLIGISVLVNLSILGIFKYFDFFVNSAVLLLRGFGFSQEFRGLDLVLPIGISFYTLQTLGYTIDVYRGRQEPVRNIDEFFAYVAFFPQLVAGPIERAGHLIPQLRSRRKFDDYVAGDGVRQMLNGYIKKVLIADNLAPYVDRVFDDYGSYGGSVLTLAAVLFAVQIYCDFSGYSDIAIGCGRLFGIELVDNFRYPYFSRSIKEFWRRWHISLSTWFRDYVYIPIGGCRRRPLICARNIMITFVISGLWHGANWTFVVWGLYNGIMVIPGILLGRRRSLGVGSCGRRFWFHVINACSTVLTISIVLVGWIVFRSNSIADAVGYMAAGIGGTFAVNDMVGFQSPLALSAILISGEAIQRNRRYLLDVDNLPAAVRWGVYYVAIVLIMSFGAVQGSDFIYFRF